MIELKKELIKLINSIDDEDILGNAIVRCLNKYCDALFVWHFKVESLIAKFHIQNQEKYINIVESLVGCRYFTDSAPVNNILTLKFSLSTLVEELSKLSGEDLKDDFEYVPVQMDRFKKLIPPVDTIHFDKKDRYIIDNQLLSDSLGTYTAGIIFSATTSDEKVNDRIIDEVLKLINTDDSLTI